MADWRSRCARRVDQAARARHLDLHRLEIRDLGAGVGARALGHRLPGTARRRPRPRRARPARADGWRRPRSGCRKSGPGVERRARMLEAAAAALQRQRAALGHEQLGDRDVLAAGRRHAHGVPGVDDLVVGLRHQAQPPVDRRLAVVAIDRDGQHVPVGIVDARGERPAAVDDEAAVGLAPAAGRERDRGGDQRVGVGVPHLVLRLGLVVAEDPVMAGEVADVPGRRRAAARKLRRDVHDRDEVELHAAERLGLMEAEQPALVQQLLVLADQHRGRLRRFCARSRSTGTISRARRMRLVVADAGEIAARRPAAACRPRGWDHWRRP